MSARWVKKIVAKEPAEAAAAEKERGSRWLRALLLIVAMASFGIFGYFAAYQLFFIELPLVDIAKYQQGGAEETFIYDGIAYFDGTRLADGERTQIHTGSLRAIDGDDKGIELYVRLDQVPEDQTTDRVVGTLDIQHKWDGDVVAEQQVELTERTLQRHTIGWPTDNATDYTFDVQYVPADGSDVQSVLFGTNIVGVRFWWPMMLFGLIGLAAVATWLWFHQWRRTKQVAWFIGVLALMALLHSGGFISNEYFDSAQSSIGSAHRYAWEAIDTGELEKGEYRSLGYSMIPAIAIVVEGMHVTQVYDRDDSIDKFYFLQTFPTERYLMFLWTAIALGLLFGAVWRYIHRAVAVIFGVLYASFYPFIVDLYNVADDAYAIPLYTMFLAAFIHYVYGGRRSWRPVVAMALAIAMMLFSKVTPAFLMLLAPVAIWAGVWQQRNVSITKKLFDWRSAAVLVVLVTAGMTARSIGHIGGEIAPGEPYAKTVFWEIVWASNGRFDAYTAHWFTKSGTERSKRVENQTGLDADRSRFRHSQTAMDEVYKPQVLHALAERPGFFWSMATQRAERGGLTFYRYTVGGSKRWSEWLQTGYDVGEMREISGRKVRPVHLQMELVREGKYWKIAPLVTLTRFVQNDMSKELDYILIGLAIFGIFLLRRWDMILVLLGSIGAKLAFGVFVHIPVRYVNFNNVGLLLALAVALYCIALATGLIARRSFRNHALLETRRPNCTSAGESS